MGTHDQDPTPGTREHFLRVTQLRCWGTIQAYVELCRAQGYCTPAFYATAIVQMERIHVQRRLKQVTNAHGWPVFGNIRRVRDNGRPQRVFLVPGPFCHRYSRLLHLVYAPSGLIESVYPD
jgi:hypothetical protein